MRILSSSPVLEGNEEGFNKERRERINKFLPRLVRVPTLSSGPPSEYFRTTGREDVLVVTGKGCDLVWMLNGDGYQAKMIALVRVK